MPSLRFSTLVSLFCILFFVSCSPVQTELLSETDEKQYQRGKLFLRNGRTEDALNAFLGVIDSRRDAPESHFEAGYIFLREMRDPVRAYYHFSRYLELFPQSDRAREVSQLMETAQKEFARQLPAQPFEGQLDRVDLMELIKNLREENDSLKQDLMAAESRVQQFEGMMGQARRVPPAEISSTIAPLPEASTSGTSTPQTYTVQSGDTLNGISRKVYGTTSRWVDIFQANRDRMSSENALRVGQELRIP
ncbi:MAG: LysM peptidoglycan-binding domain-containing protein [Coraliomargaritaceae bacterium]